MLQTLSLAIGATGVAIIVWGIILGALGLVRLELDRLKGATTIEGRETVRHDIGYYILLGLEFLIAADVVGTVLTPNLDELAVLGAIVAIRTVIGFSLNWELQQAPAANQAKITRFQAGATGHRQDPEHGPD